MITESVVDHNAFLKHNICIQSFFTMNIAKGLASVFTKTQSVSWPMGSDPENGWFRNIVSYNDFPVGIVIFLAVAVICGIILYRTKPGRIFSALVLTVRRFAFPV